MIFYHFTGHQYIERIREHGLTEGSIQRNAFDKETSEKVIWLTTDKNPDGHGLADRDEKIPENIAQLLGLGSDEKFYDKRAIRITLVWPKKKVKRFLPWGRKHLEQKWLNALIDTGGGLVKAKTWYISFEPIPPSAFKNIEMLRE